MRTPVPRWARPHATRHRCARRARLTRPPWTVARCGEERQGPRVAGREPDVERPPPAAGTQFHPRRRDRGRPQVALQRVGLAAVGRAPLVRDRGRQPSPNTATAVPSSTSSAAVSSGGSPPPGRPLPASRPATGPGRSADPRRRRPVQPRPGVRRAPGRAPYDDPACPHRRSPTDFGNVRGVGYPRPVVRPGIGPVQAAGARSSTDRASDYGSEGLGFESLRARQRLCRSGHVGCARTRGSGRPLIPESSSLTTGILRLMLDSCPPRLAGATAPAPNANVGLASGRSASRQPRTRPLAGTGRSRSPSAAPRPMPTPTGCSCLPVIVAVRGCRPRTACLVADPPTRVARRRATRGSPPLRSDTDRWSVRC